MAEPAGSLGGGSARGRRAGVEKPSPTWTSLKPRRCLGDGVGRQVFAEGDQPVFVVGRVRDKAAGGGSGTPAGCCRPRAAAAGGPAMPIAAHQQRSGPASASRRSPAGSRCSGAQDSRWRGCRGWRAFGPDHNGGSVGGRRRRRPRGQGHVAGDDRAKKGLGAIFGPWSCSSGLDDPHPWAPRRRWAPRHELADQAAVALERRSTRRRQGHADGDPVRAPARAW